MNFDRSSNPAFRSEYFQSTAAAGQVMTIQGTINKIGFLMLLLIASGSFTWKMALEQNMPAVQSLMYLGIFGGLITALFTVFSPRNARFSAPIYAVFEGLALGGLSGLSNLAYPGIVFNAVMLTLATLFGMLFLYKTEIVKPTERFKAGVMSATMGVCFAYLFSFILSMFGLASPIHATGGVGIIISLVVVVIAALNLIIDFDMIVKGASSGAPEHMEWYGAFGLLVTLVWLYLELLRLLAAFQRRD
ncbi:MAG TPA: Bax inhibitor-1/YccA family protein [Candidatus Rifleibacterium sp.]|nr:Bax inhibitor-1/YccA family protein [Candidatus Rifleibacterium sp.]